MRINVYAEDRGWLFEDLKAHFARLDRPARRVEVSKRPLAGADAWVALRTEEAGLSPDLPRTLACLHDVFDDGLYAPGGRRAAVRRAGGLALCHPEQRHILAAAGVDLAGREVLERPLGALSRFRPRQRRPPVFTVGWVGRNHPRKRLPWFLAAVRALAVVPGGDLRVVLLGQDLETAAGELIADGIDCSLHRRESHPIAAYPRLYRGLDGLVITSASEAGPLPLFEALASGVPVVSTPVGWAPRLARECPYVLIAHSPEEIAARLGDLWRVRGEMLERRHDIAARVAAWTLEGWLSAVLRAAGTLARRRSQSGL